MPKRELFFFDLDGPLLDVAEKYHRVYSDILAESGYLAVPLEEYWLAKREKVPELDILARTGAQGIIDKYKHKRKERIESDAYLALDRLQPGALEVLDELGARYELVLVTLRSQRMQLDKQLAKLDLTRRFSLILSSGLEITPRWRVKHDLILERFPALAVRAAGLIGDTETDILAAKALGIFAVGVLSGIRCESILGAAGPDRIIDGVAGLPGLLKSK